MIFTYFNLGNPVNPVYSAWSQTHKLGMKITYFHGRPTVSVETTPAMKTVEQVADLFHP